MSIDLTKVETSVLLPISLLVWQKLRQVSCCPWVYWSDKSWDSCPVAHGYWSDKIRDRCPVAHEYCSDKSWDRCPVAHEYWSDKSRDRCPVDILWLGSAFCWVQGYTVKFVYWTLNKNGILYKTNVPMLEIFVNFTCINLTPAYSEHKSWS